MISESILGVQKPKKCRRKRQKYSKVPLKSKILFFQKVVHQQGNLRQMAKKLGIKYSTAKTMIRNYKSIPEQQNLELVQSICHDFDKKIRARKRCTYRMIEETTESSSSSVKVQSKSHKPQTGQISIICTMLGVHRN